MSSVQFHLQQHHNKITISKSLAKEDLLSDSAYMAPHPRARKYSFNVIYVNVKQRWTIYRALTSFVGHTKVI